MRTEDGYIIGKCLDGDSAAFGLLVDKYKEGIYALAYSKLGNFHDAEDVTQEVFIRVYRKLHTLKRYDSFHAWLYATTANLCKNWIRAYSRRPDSEFIEDESPGALEAISVNDYQSNVAQHSIHDSLQEALDSLPDTHREVLTLHYLGGMSGKEIARFLGIAPMTAWQRLSRARSQLKEEMIAMMSSTFKKQGLPSGFTLRIVDMVSRMKVHPFPRTTGIPWGISLAAGIVITVLSLSLHPSILSHITIPADSLPSAEAKVLRTGEIPVDVLTFSEMSTISDWQSGGRGGSRGLGLQNTPTSVMESQEGHALDQQHASGTQSDSDLAAIRRLFLTLERGYEERDIEKYMSVFSSEEYEFIEHMRSPDDHIRDVHFVGIENQRRSVKRIFDKGYEILDMELTYPDITIDGDSAEVRSDAKLLFQVPEVAWRPTIQRGGNRSDTKVLSQVSEDPAFPRVFYTTTLNVYSVKKFRGEWKIVRWESHDTPLEALDARRRRIEDKGVEALIRELGSDDKAIWGMAMADLGTTREENITPLINALHYPDKSVKYRIIWILAGTTDYDAIGALADVLGSEGNDADIRVAAAKALFNSRARLNPGHPALDRALFVEMRSSGPEIRSATCLLLALRFSWRMYRFLEYAAEAGWSKDDTETIRAKMVKSLMESLGSPNPNLKRQAIISLGHLRHQPALAPLARMLLDKDEDYSVRYQAISSISVIDQDRAFDALVQIMKDKGEIDSLRSMAGRMLAEYKDGRSVSLFLNVLEDKVELPRLRQTAIRYLKAVSHLESVYHNEAFIQALETAVGDEDGEIAAIAQETLSEIEAKLAEDIH